MGTVAPVGTLVAVHPEAAYRVGDIVTYERKNRSYTHRIVDITDQGYITKGDINDATDALPVQPDEVVGLVTVRLRYAGFLLQGLRGTHRLCGRLRHHTVASGAPVVALARSGSSAGRWS